MAADAPANFHMVTFHLGQKSYGINIMHVKEISTSKQFTTVPNTPSHIRGVFNLRGEIIPVLDLRLFLKLQEDQDVNQQDSALVILTLEQNTVAVVVDSISHVIVAKQEHLKQQHPLFRGNIRGQYVAGILEHQDKLYIVLDIANILAHTDHSETLSNLWQKNLTHSSQEPVSANAAVAEEHDPATAAPSTATAGMSATKTELSAPLSQAAEEMARHCRFRHNPTNHAWFCGYLKHAFDSQGNWLSQKKELLSVGHLPLSFLSPCRYRIWDKALTKRLRGLLGQQPPVSNFHAWIVDCGLGHEAYSLMAALKLSLPDSQPKLLASDYRYQLISQAQTLSVPSAQLPDLYRSFTRPHSESHDISFTDELNEAITFDYADPLYKYSQAPQQLIVARDVLSRYGAEDMEVVLELFWRSLVPRGMLILGVNERLKTDYRSAVYDSFTVYYKPDQRPKNT